MCRCILDEMEVIMLGDDTQSYSSDRVSRVSTLGSPKSEQVVSAGCKPDVSAGLAGNSKK